jgi:uncharacterized membrane protein YbhN (UPF0104 family)
MPAFPHLEICRVARVEQAGYNVSQADGLLRGAGRPRILPLWMKHIKHRSWLQIAGGILVGAICLWLSLRGIEFAQVAGQIGRVAWPWVALATLSVVGVSAGKALRWRWLYPQAAPPVAGLAHFNILMIAQMLNVVVPVRLGELARLGLMQQEGRPAGVTLGTIVVEKSLDLLTVGTLLFLAVPIAVLPDWLRPKAGPGALLTALALMISLLLVRLLRVPLLRALSAIPAPPSPAWSRARGYLVSLVRTVLDGIAGVEGRRVAPVLAVTVLVWLLSVGTILAMLVAFGVTDGGERIALVLMLALTFSNLVPTPPALLGVVGAVTVAVCVPFGIARVEALTLGTLLNAVMVLPTVLLGGWATGARLLRLFEPGRRGSLRQLFGLAATGGGRGR